MFKSILEKADTSNLLGINKFSWKTSLNSKLCMKMEIMGQLYEVRNHKDVQFFIQVRQKILSPILSSSKY